MTLGISLWCPQSSISFQFDETQTWWWPSFQHSDNYSHRNNGAATWWGCLPLRIHSVQLSKRLCRLQYQGVKSRYLYPLFSLLSCHRLSASFTSDHSSSWKSVCFLYSLLVVITPSTPCSFKPTVWKSPWPFPLTISSTPLPALKCWTVSF